MKLFGSIVGLIFVAQSVFAANAVTKDKETSKLGVLRVTEAACSDTRGCGYELNYYRCQYVDLCCQHSPPVPCEGFEYVTPSGKVIEVSKDLAKDMVKTRHIPVQKETYDKNGNVTYSENL